MPLIEGNTVYASQDADVVAREGAAPLEYRRLSTPSPLDGPHSSAWKVRFGIYYGVGPDGIVELRASLKAHGVTLRYPSSPSE